MSDERENEAFRRGWTSALNHMAKSLAGLRLPGDTGDALLGKQAGEAPEGPMSGCGLLGPERPDTAPAEGAGEVCDACLCAGGALQARCGKCRGVGRAPGRSR